MIELRNIHFSYGREGFELQVDQLTVSQGEHVCWIGPSGSGKTTLLHLVAGIFSPDAGQVKTCDVDLTSLRDSARRHFRIANIGLVFQDFALLDYLSVLDNILLPYRISPELSLEPTVRERAANLARKLGLGHYLSRRPGQLSQGEQQRVAVCRAIVTQPKLILADEPTANLDASNSARVLEALEEYANEHAATLIFVSHDQDVIRRFDNTFDVSRFCLSPPPLVGEGDKHA